MKLLVVIICIVIVWLIEHNRISCFDSLPKEDQDKLVKEQSQMRCANCFSTDLEVIGMKHGRLQWQCKHCKKIRR